MPTKSKATTATAITDLSLAACKGDTNVAERKAIDALRLAHVHLARGEQEQKDLEAREAALLVTLAETTEALANVKSAKSFNAYAVGLKRKNVEEINAHVLDALKVARQTAFKAGARGAGLFANMNVVRAMAQRLDNHDDYVDPDATTEEEEEEEEEELGYHPSSPKFTPITPPGSPSKVPRWGAGG